MMTRPSTIFHHAPARPILETDPELEAYNAAFEELELDWHWDSATMRELVGPGSEAERIAGWLRRHRPHLAKAYDVDALAREIVEARDRLRVGATSPHRH
ncbi:MAG: hypothetical protein DYH14_07920 [Betaproteobacteria bacterium PRO3]|nr:hypothetical protein [Betaproteobacteria bacterium PRO3]